MLIQNPPVQLADHLWMLGTTAYPLYLVKGATEGAIVEGGIGAVGPIVREQLVLLGVAPEFVRQVVITHAHPDHVMAVPLLRELFPGISVVASSIAAATLASEKTVDFFRQLDGALTSGLAKAGAAEAAPPDCTRSVQSTIAVDRTVAEGDIIAVDDIAWTVLHTPGHSDCSISLHDPARRALVISDATGYYMPQQRAWWPCYFTGYAVYLKSIERLAALGAEVLCLSHNGAVVGAEDVQAYFAGAIDATRQYHQRIVADARAGKTTRQIAEQLGTEIHQQTPVLPLEFFQKNCGLLVKQSLKNENV